MMIAGHRGFTLVELVITLGLTIVVTAFAAMFITRPVQGYIDQDRRAMLVDNAESALHRFSRDIRSALPNSVRVLPVGTGFAVEMLNAIDGARYRAGPPPADNTKSLQFNVADAQFNVLGGFTTIALPFTSTNHYLSIYNAGVPGADAWQLANVITPPGVQIDISADSIADEAHVSLSLPFQFSYASPSQRIYLLDGPLSWLCDPVNGTFTRYQGYSIATDQTTRDSNAELTGAGATASVAAENVSGCAINYSSGTAQRSGLVSARLALSQAGENVVLQHQIHVENAP